MNKDQARELVWSELRNVAKPDARFHLDFNEFIPDFEGSDQATERLCALDIYQNAKTLFITPDNCLVDLRAQTLRDKKTQIVSTHGIRRGLVELRPEDVPSGHESYAVVLDMLEKMGHNITLQTLRERYGHIDMLVTGASAVNHAGVRFGKGHGYFDLEWAMLYQLGLVDETTSVVAFVHDCQVVDLDLEFSPYDTLCDVIVTPTRVITLDAANKPDQGILWDKLQPGMIEDMPILLELK